MANTVADIEKQIADLQTQKKKLIETSKKETIKNIKSLIEQYSITASELGFKSKTTTKNNAVKSKAMYANPDYPEQTWTGKGRQPEWVKGFITLNGSLDKALIK